MSISLAYNVISLYMYELAVQHVSSPEPSKTPRARGKIKQSYTQPGFITALTSTIGILETFSKFSVQEIRALPIVHFAQIAHASVSLIKMYFGVKINKDVPVTTIKTEQRLGSVLDSLRSSAADGKSLAAHTYLKVIGAIQTVFKEHKHTTIESIKARFISIPSMKGTPVLDPEERQPTPRQRTAPHGTGEMLANKLDLLSAAAMEQSNANVSEAGSGQLGGRTPEDGEMAAMGQLIGEGTMSDECFLVSCRR